MIKNPKIFILPFIILFIISCGYRMVGFERDKSKYKYFIKEIVNNNSESDYYNTLKESVELFFSNYNSLTDENNADFNVFITLANIKISSTIKSASAETVSSDMTVTLKIKLTDKNGKIVFDKTMSYKDSYRAERNVSANISNRNQAFKSIVQSILSDFKYEFEKAK